MVSEQVAWFEQFRSPVPEFQFRLVDSQAIDGTELSYGAPSVPTNTKTRYDGLIEIADWENAEAQGEAVQQAMASGIYAPVMDLVAGPFKATRIG